MDRLDTTTTVDTPERVRFSHRLAGPGLRAAAWGVDFLLQALVVLLGWFALVVLGSLGELPQAAGAGLGFALFFVLSWFYAAAFEWWWSGQTPGKRLAQIRVVRDDGGPIGGQEALLRNLLRGVDSLPFGYVVAVVVCTFDRRLRRIGDLVAGTMVVVEQRTGLLDAVPVDPPVTEAERQAIPIGVTLRGEERRAIEALLRRRPRLHAARVEKLALDLGVRIAEREGITAPTALRTLTLAYARVTGRDA